MKTQLIAAAALVLAALPAFAQEAATEKPYVSSTQTVQLTAEVVAGVTGKADHADGIDPYTIVSRQTGRPLLTGADCIRKLAQSLPA